MFYWKMYDVYKYSGLLKIIDFNKFEKPMGRFCAVYYNKNRLYYLKKCIYIYSMFYLYVFTKTIIIM